MVEKSNADYTQRGAAAMLLTNKLQGMSLDDRASRLSSFVPKSVLYDEALSATKVELVKDEETDLDVVKKVIRKNKLLSEDNWKYARQECGIHQMVSNHNNIVKLYEHGETDTEFQMYMEYCDKANSLTDKVRDRLTPVGNNQKLLSYAEDILTGLHHAHQHGVVHADIKLENILKQSPDVVEEYDIAKICDFGLSGKINPSDGKLNMQRVGTIGYMAPELGKGPVDQSIDMFSFGVVLYELAAAYKPTAVRNYKYGSGPIPFRNVDWRRRNRNIQDLIEQCMHSDPTQRISVADALQHPWFSEETDD